MSPEPTAGAITVMPGTFSGSIVPQKPTAGALRASQIITQAKGVMPFEMTEYAMAIQINAQTIDRETGIRELLDALRKAENVASWALSSASLSTQAYAAMLVDRDMMREAIAKHS